MRMLYTSLFLLGFLISGISFAAEKAHWGYTGHEGPEHWGELSPAYATCSSGKNQSPVNLTKMVEGELPKLSFNYEIGGGEVINNGHAIQINYPPGNTMSVADRTFELKQVHFHSPSENTIEGKSFPMESHYVHADKEGNLAVVAVMYMLGKPNDEMEKAWAHMPAKAGESNSLPKSVDAKGLLPFDNAYYRFNGSLTTPPCTEGVNWYVMKLYRSISEEQLEKFVHAMHHDTNRPVQPINARVVIK